MIANLVNHSRNKNPWWLSLLLLVALIVSSCNPVKYVPVDETLLDKNDLRVEEGKVKKGELEGFIKQQPNKQIFGSRFHLGLYNLSNLEKEGWPHGWLRNIGEAPVIYDPYQTQKSAEQLGFYLFSKGYFRNEVSYTESVKKRQTTVNYRISPGAPYRVRKIQYQIEDTVLAPLVYMDTLNSYIERGEAYDEDLMQRERSRIENFIRDQGFYAFSKENIGFGVDSTAGDHQVDIYVNLLGRLQRDRFNQLVRKPHEKYKIKQVNIFSNYDPQWALSAGDAYYSDLDTVLYNGFHIISSPRGPYVKNQVVLQSNYIQTGNPFNITNVERTQQHLNSLGVFRLINIGFEETDPEARNEYGEHLLDCNIQLTPVTQQSYTVELEGTNSAGNLGGAVNLIYQHRNLFHGAEQFNLKLKGSYEALTEDLEGKRSTQEFGAETSLALPKFLLPVLNSGEFVKKYNPKTRLSFAYNYQKMPVYTRTVANAGFAYEWRASRYSTYQVTPFQINAVRLPFISDRFQARIDTTAYLAFSYNDVFIQGAAFTYIYSNQSIQQKRDYIYYKFNLESAGNLLSSLYKLSDQPQSEEVYEIFNQPFAQYFRAELDLRYNALINEASSLVYRAFIGLGYPFGNSRVMPFEKQYFGGGANGIRAWQVRSLGPGSSEVVEGSFFNQTADIRLEANLEYRFKLFWLLEGAWFVDVGNIWTWYEDEDRPGARFGFSHLLDDLAIGTGLGARLDFNFFILRFDAGLKMRDPQMQGSSKWIRSVRKFNFRDDVNFHIGIGYPF